VITGLRDNGKYLVVLRGIVYPITPKPFERLCTLAWHVYKNPPQGWWYYRASGDEANAVYKSIDRLRDAMKGNVIIESDRGGCYRLVLTWDDIQWHVESLKTVIDEDLNKVLRRVMTVLGVTGLPGGDDALGG
jgi:hypothetical protein